MNNLGFVPLRRGILDHVVDGRLSAQEFTVLTVLILLADKETGTGRVNGPALTAWLPDLSLDASKRALLSLEDKRYIYREIIHRSKRLYRYWVHKYEPTVGPHKSLQTDISQVFESNDVRDVKYVEAAPQGALQAAPQGALQTAPQGALHNNKDKDKDKENDTPSIGIEECASCESPDAFSVSTVNSDASAQCDPARAHVTRTTCAHDYSTTTPQLLRDDSMTTRMTPLSELKTALEPAGAGMKWSGSEGAFVDSQYRVIPPMEVDRRLATVGLRRVQQEFFDAYGDTAVPWEEAQKRIAGTKGEKAA